MPIRLLDQERNQGALLRDSGQQAVFAKGFYATYGKRALDILAATAGLIVLSPVFGLVACCIKLTSRGPVLFRQVRIGKDGRPFRILKFRSMMQSSIGDLKITVAGDSRVTRVDRKSTRLNSSHRCISYAVFCLKKKK